MKKQLAVLSILCLMTLCACTQASDSTSGGVSLDSITSSTSNNSEPSIPSSGPSSSDTTSTGGGSIGSVTKPSETVTGNPDGDISETDELDYIVGLDNIEVAQGQYFDPLRNVMAFTKEGINATGFLQVKGSVDYGKTGDYNLTYSININGNLTKKTRTITVANKPISRVSLTKSYSSTVVNVGSAIYRSGDGEELDQPPVAEFLEEELQNRPVPTNGWWTTMLSSNYGGSNGIFTNPLRSSFSADGVEITDTSSSFTQYWTDSEGALSVADFFVANKDLILKADNLEGQYTTRVIDYSDNAVKIAMRNNKAGADEMVVSMTQGSPYIFAEMNGKNGSFHLNQASNLPYEFYALNGQKLTSSYTGSAVIVKLPKTHIGYVCEIPTTPNSTIVRTPIYQDKYYLINVPNDTRFTFTRDKHANDAFLDKIGFTLGAGNYLSVAPINNLDEASYYNEHGYAFISRANSTYNVDHQLSEVTTYYRDNYISVNNVDATPLLGLLPHQYKYSNAQLSGYTMKSIRGEVKLINSNSFITVQKFAGMLPTYTLPTNTAFSKSTAENYLASLDSHTNETFGDTNEERKGPYWDAKTFYPLAQGAVIAEQLDNEQYKNKFVTKIEEILTDWFTYSGEEDDTYFYYNQRYGTMYYSNNEFNTATELSDHHFTHGYLLYAASIASMYDANFYNEYKDIISLLVRDYMTIDRTDTTYPYMRTFDPWAGHSWAHGYGFFAEGNNQESSGEALNSWIAGYLFGLQSGNQELVDAAIYGFTTELNAIKQYVFDYDQTIFSDAYTSAANISAIIWGGKNTYATWFGLNANFVYGIHYLPIGEYVSGYAIGNYEVAQLNRIYTKYAQMKTRFTDTWMANMWSVQALVNPDAAIANFDASRILADDYPNDLLSAYWNVNAAKTLGTRTNEVVIANDGLVAGDVYKNGDNYIAQLWNASDEVKTVTFVTRDGVTLSSVNVNPRSFVQVNL